MAGALKIGFSSYSAPAKGVLIVFAGPDLAFGPATRQIPGPDRRSGLARAAGPTVSRAKAGARST